MEAILAVNTVALTERDAFLRELYETIYGIHNHVTDKDPLGAMVYRENKDLNTHDPLKRRMKNYVRYRIKETWDLSLLEYLNNPPHVIKYLNSMADEFSAEESDRLDKISEKMKSESR